MPLCGNEVLPITHQELLVSLNEGEAQPGGFRRSEYSASQVVQEVVNTVGGPLALAYMRRRAGQ
jgi:hypothetical protein